MQGAQSSSVSSGLPFFIDPQSLPANLQASLRQHYSTNQTTTGTIPLRLLVTHVPLSISTGRMVPSHQSPTPSGLISDSRTFGTRKPNANTDALFIRFRTQPGLETMDDSGISEGKSRLYIRSDNGAIADVLNRRLVEHLSTDPVNRQFLDRMTIRTKLQESDQSMMQAHSEAGVQGKNLMWDGAFINDSLREPSMFKPGLLPPPGSFKVQDATQWEAGTAIGDALVMCYQTGRCAGSVEDKPKFHHARMKEVHNLAADMALPVGGNIMLKGFYIERLDTGSYATSFDLPNSSKRAVISKSEVYVYIQATEQCYAYGTRFCIIHGHEGHQIAYLAKPNLLLIGDVIPYKAGKHSRFTATAAVVALCLPPLSDEHLKLPAELIPTKEAVGLQYDQDRLSSTPQPFAMPSASTQSSSDTNIPLDPNPPSYYRQVTQVPMPPLDKAISEVTFGKSVSPTSLRLRFDAIDLGQTAGDWKTLATALDGVRLDLVSGKTETNDNSTDPSTPINRRAHDVRPSPPDSNGSCHTSSSDGSPLRYKKITANTARPVFTPPSSADIECDVISIQFISTGATGHTFSGYLPSLQRRIVLKIAAPSAQKAIVNEASIYQHLAESGAASSLAPYCFGLYRTYPSCSLDTRILVTEDGGPGLDERHDDWDTLNVFDVIELKQCLQMLHAQRIAHGDLQLRHLRISPYTSKLNLIDFSHSTLDASDEMLEQEDEWVTELVG